MCGNAQEFEASGMYLMLWELWTGSILPSASHPIPQLQLFFFSISLLALVEAQYRFIWIEVGGVVHLSDAQIYNDLELSEVLEERPDRVPTINSFAQR